MMPNGAKQKRRKVDPLLTLNTGQDQEKALVREWYEKQPGTAIIAFADLMMRDPEGLRAMPDHALTVMSRLASIALVDLVINNEKGKTAPGSDEETGEMGETGETGGDES